MEVSSLRSFPMNSHRNRVRSCKWFAVGLGLAVVTASLAVALVASPAVAQGVLIDVRVDQPVPLPRPIVIWPRPVPPRPPRVVQPPSTYRIDELSVNADIEDQVARVQVSQTFENTGSVAMEVSFVFPLPYDGAIDRLTLLVDGKEYDAKLLSKDEARRRYEEIVRKNRDPALLEWVGNGMFQTSVFPIPPGAKRVGHAPLLATPAQELRPLRLSLPAQHGQVHVEAARKAEPARGDRKQVADH